MEFVGEELVEIAPDPVDVVLLEEVQPDTLASMDRAESDGRSSVGSSSIPVNVLSSPPARG